VFLGLSNKFLRLESRLSCERVRLDDTWTRRIVNAPRDRSKRDRSSSSEPIRELRSNRTERIGKYRRTRFIQGNATRGRASAHRVRIAHLTPVCSAYATRTHIHAHLCVRTATRPLTIAAKGSRARSRATTRAPPLLLGPPRVGIIFI